MNRWASKPPREDYAKRYQCKKCGSTQRLFVQCVPCLTKFVEANAIVEISNRFVNSQVQPVSQQMRGDGYQKTQ